jgi:hypothetical protein
MAKAIWRKNEKLYTALQDLMRTYLMHDHTPNIEKQLKEQFDEYFKWHEDNWERGHIESFGGPTGSQLNRYILAGKLALSAPRLLPGSPDFPFPLDSMVILTFLMPGTSSEP